MRAEVLAGMRDGTPRTGPLQVHIDVTNTCNAACITCWDHSPLLHQPRPGSWKRNRLDLSAFHALVDQLAAMGSVQAVVLSGMGEPLTHPDIYAMMERVKSEGWHLTVLSNLVAADIDKLAAAGVDNLLVGVHGATPTAYTAFHPGWSEAQFFTMCGHLRDLHRAGVNVRHVQVINRDTAPELVQMVRFGRTFRAERVNFKLASLAGGTEDCAITEDQRQRLLHEQIPEARALADQLGVHTNLDLFERQVRVGDPQATVPVDAVGCWMGFVYTRITVDLEVLYCCNTEVKVGSLGDGPFQQLWYGPRWQALRDRMARHDWLPGCERCGKFEQNHKWSQRMAEAGP